MIVTDDPTAHEAAVAVSVDAEAIGIDIGAFANFVDGGHEIEEVFATPVAEDGFEKVWAVGGGSSGIDSKNDVACAGEYLVGDVKII